MEIPQREIPTRRKHTRVTSHDASRDASRDVAARDVSSRDVCHTCCHLRKRFVLHDIRIRRALSLGLTSSTGDAKVDMLHLGADDHHTKKEQFVCACVSAHGQRLVAVTTHGQVVPRVPRMDTHATHDTL